MMKFKKWLQIANFGTQMTYLTLELQCFNKLTNFRIFLQWTD
jgi:hypothetical protein